MRKSKEELNLIKDKYNVDRLWSWSKYNTYKNDKYEYMLKYIKHIVEDRTDSIYTHSGTLVHTVTQDYYEGKSKYDEMLGKYEDELCTLKLMGLKYNRTDEDKNTQTANKYENCIRHYLANHTIIDAENILIEPFILVKVGDNLFQGYIDILYKKDGIYHIIDLKTSSRYMGKKILKEQGQLLLYSESLIQQGIPIDKIRTSWNFCKYATIEMPQKNGKIKTTHTDRIDIAKSLVANISMWMKHKGYSEIDISMAVDTMLETNSIDNLPDDIKKLYTIKDCIVDIALTQENIDNLKKDIIETLDEIKSKEKEYNKTKDDNIFWVDVTDENSFYFSTLCSYSANHHLPYKKYLENREKDGKTTYDDGGVKDEDLSWLYD